MAMHANVVDSFNAVWMDVLKTDSQRGEMPMETYLAELIDVSTSDAATITGFEYNDIRVLKMFSVLGDSYAWLQEAKLIVKYGQKIDDFFKETTPGYLSGDTRTTSNADAAEHYIGDGVLGRHLGQRINKLQRLLSK